MFRISKRLNYGLKLLVALAREDDNKHLATAKLAESLEIPLPFLHQIGHVLMQSGLVKALPGPRGGLRLGKPASSISILEIVETLEGTIDLDPGAKLAGTPNEVLFEGQPFWKGLQAVIIHHLGEITLEQLSANSDFPVELPLNK
jgi:Rrf2 family protein